MIKKVLVSVIVVNTLFFYIFMKFLHNQEQVKKQEIIEKNIVDINKTNGLINTYSNYVEKIIPADE